MVPRTPQGRHALCALLSRERVLPVAQRRLAAGDLALHGLFGEVDTAWLEGEALARLDPEGLALSNVNTPEDLARVERRLTPAGG